MLDRSGDDVVAFVTQRICGAGDREMVSLRCARGEYDLGVASCADYVADGTPSGGNRLRGSATVAVRAGGVAVAVDQVWEHRLQIGSVDAGGSAPVQQRLEPVGRQAGRHACGEDLAKDILASWRSSCR